MNVYVIKQNKFTISQAGRHLPVNFEFLAAHTQHGLSALSPRCPHSALWGGMMHSHTTFFPSAHTARTCPLGCILLQTALVPLATLRSQYGQLVHLKSALLGKESACPSKRGREGLPFSPHYRAWFILIGSFVLRKQFVCSFNLLWVNLKASN